MELWDTFCECDQESARLEGKSEGGPDLHLCHFIKAVLKFIEHSRLNRTGSPQLNIFANLGGGAAGVIPLSQEDFRRGRRVIYQVEVQLASYFSIWRRHWAGAVALIHILLCWLNTLYQCPGAGWFQWCCRTPIQYIYIHVTWTAGTAFSLTD